MATLICIMSMHPSLPCQGVFLVNICRSSSCVVKLLSGVQVFDWVMCSEEKKDAHRFRDIILAAIKEGHVKQFPRFEPWSKKVEKQPRPKNPLAKKKKSKSQSNDQQLVAQIRCICYLLTSWSLNQFVARQARICKSSNGGIPTCPLMHRGAGAARMDSTFAALEAKYCNPDAKGKRKAKELTEEQFAKAQKKVQTRKAQADAPSTQKAKKTKKNRGAT